MPSRSFSFILAATSAAMLISACGSSDTPVASAQTAPCASAAAARCGTVTVPLDRANPRAGTTTVAYAVVAHRNRAVPSAGAVLFNPGGPGEPAIAHAAEIAEQLAPLLATRDLLLIDPRGTGRSAALSCRVF